ncbi:MAG: putative phosphonates utilization ATP-binding protein PhnK [Dehalococcoidia bacterium]|nr:putative phosphonates utilization ATP-binding protein PhnK [Bacillota bacterium]MBT9139906.1 putative phosphonates utilization ATP-binding protein PhnK [Bacillota bacterium]
MREWILKVEGLTKIYPAPAQNGRICPECLKSTANKCVSCGSTIAVASASFTLYQREILGVMGESGSGKSILVRSLYFDIIPTFGEAYLNRERKNIFQLNSQEKRRLKNFNMGIAYQNPHLGLNFDISAGGNVAEKLLVANWRSHSNIRKRLIDLFEKTELPLNRMDDFPSTLSGGMQQRIQIAKALANNPEILFLDEPTSGLDLSVQARLLDLIKEIQQELKISMILVSHDLGVLRLLADRILVMKEGRIIESGLTDQILEDPQCHYTQLLVNSML